MTGSWRQGLIDGDALEPKQAPRWTAERTRARPASKELRLERVRAPRTREPSSAARGGRVPVGSVTLRCSSTCERRKPSAPQLAQESTMLLAPARKQGFADESGMKALETEAGAPDPERREGVAPHRDPLELLARPAPTRSDVYRSITDRPPLQLPPAMRRGDEDAAVRHPRKREVDPLSDEHGVAVRTAEARGNEEVMPTGAVVDQLPPAAVVAAPTTRKNDALHSSPRCTPSSRPSRRPRCR